MGSTLDRRTCTGRNRPLDRALSALALGAAILCGTLPALASGPGAGKGPEAASSQAPPDGGREREWVWLPEGRLYDLYTADPLQHTFSVQWITVPDEGIADSGSPRFGLQLGGSFAIFRRQPGGRPDRGWQLSFEAGASLLSDIQTGWDVIGWDGIAGLLVTTALDDGLSAKAGVMHRSAHLGDELIERTSRNRIDYTREEFVAGLSWDFAGAWRVYGEAGWAFTNQAEDLQEPLRAQGGLEFESPRHFLDGRGGWYAATNVNSFEERDWQADIGAETGFYWYTGPRRWRAGIRYYSGRVPLGQFFLDDEKWILVGIWHDI